MDLNDEIECYSDGDSYVDDTFVDEYFGDEDVSYEQKEPKNTKNIEAFEVRLLEVDDVEKLVSNTVNSLADRLSVPPSMAKLLLYLENWNTAEIISRFEAGKSVYLQKCHLCPLKRQTSMFQKTCEICDQEPDCENVIETATGSCGHSFCGDCWNRHFQMQMQTLGSIQIECMANGCRVLMLEDFITEPKSRSDEVRLKYNKIARRCLSSSNPRLTPCPSSNCNANYLTSESLDRINNTSLTRVDCERCSSKFCFRCSNDYHAPTNCRDIAKWLIKCQDESKTANYLRAYTKNCPKCGTAIEKNDGCNHMTCQSNSKGIRCGYEFCWLCLDKWDSFNHSCNKYEKGSDKNADSEAIFRYFFYFDRWDNHARSLEKEAVLRDRIAAVLDEKLKTDTRATWIDWCPVRDATDILLKARYTLQYTYPHAYFLKAGIEKDLFENHQAQLEIECEELSSHLEHFVFEDRAKIVSQSVLVEKRRLILLEASDAQINK